MIEKLNVRIGLSGTYWNKAPEYTVLFDDQVIQQASVSAESGSTFYVNFDVDVEDDCEFQLKIRLENKENSDTVEVGVKDLLLNIDSIEFDNVDLGWLTAGKSIFIPDNRDIAPIDNCVNLGHNGTFVLTFSTPFYIWLEENI